MRLRIDLAYDGTDFKGWADQPRLRTVQGALESALATCLRTPSVRVVCAGRTDAGVHARGQVAHIDIEPETLAASGGRAEDSAEVALVRRLNGVLPADVRVRRIAAAPDGFDARFSAIWRRYVYRISDRPATHDPLTGRFVLHHSRPLAAAAMQAAADGLVGLHDFAAFCKKREGATTIRTLLELEVRRGVAGIEATVRADAFCHSMVRALMGALVTVGEGRRTPEWAAQVLAAGDRDPAAVVMPAHGLTLEEVGYPDPAELAGQAELARRRRTLDD